MILCKKNFRQPGEIFMDWEYNTEMGRMSVKGDALAEVAYLM